MLSVYRERAGYWDGYDVKSQVLDHQLTILDAYMDYKKTPSIRKVSIETINRCNGTCSFCQANRMVDERKPTYMPEETFRKIISELQRIGFKGEICMNVNNEPLLDKRFGAFSKLLRESLPECKLMIFTNGTLLNKEHMQSLLRCYDEVCIDDYEPTDTVGKKIAEAVLSGISFWKTRNVAFTLISRISDQVMLNRAGDAPNRQDSEGTSHTFKHTCLFPFWQIYFTPNGDCIPCCNDVKSKIVLGNINESSIEEIWSGEEYENFRRAMVAHERAHIDPCQHCDQICNGERYFIGDRYQAVKEMVSDLSKSGRELYIWKANETDLEPYIKRLFTEQEIELTRIDELSELQEGFLFYPKTADLIEVYREDAGILERAFSQDFIENPETKLEPEKKQTFRAYLAQKKALRNMMAAE